MKKEKTNARRTVDFSKGERGKYADLNLRIVGATTQPRTNTRTISAKPSSKKTHAPRNETINRKNG